MFSALSAVFAVHFVSSIRPETPSALASRLRDFTFCQNIMGLFGDMKLKIIDVTENVSSYIFFMPVCEETKTVLTVNRRIERRGR